MTFITKLRTSLINSGVLPLFIAVFILLTLLLGAEFYQYKNPPELTENDRLDNVLQSLNKDIQHLF